MKLIQFEDVKFDTKYFPQNQIAIFTQQKAYG